MRHETQESGAIDRLITRMDTSFEVSFVPIHDENHRKPLATITNNRALTKAPPPVPRFSSSSSCGSSSSSSSSHATAELKLARRLLEEKAKQIQNLTHQLAVSECRSQTLTEGTAKHQRGELEAKRKLWSKETTLLRQSVALKNSNSLLHSYVTRETVKITDKERRSCMERKELEAEIERLEEDFELQVIAMNEARLKLEETCTTREADYQRKIAALDEQKSHFSALTAAVAWLTEENKLLTEQGVVLEGQVATQAVAIDTLQNKFNVASADLQQRSHELANETNKSRRLLSALESMSTNHQPPPDPSDKHDVDLRDTIEQRDRQLDQFREELAEKTDQLAHATAEILRHRQEGAATSRSSSELWNSVKSLQHELALTRGEVKSKVAALEAAAVERSRLDGALVLETNRRVHLETMLSDSDQLLATLRESLAAAEVARDDALARVVSIKAAEESDLEGRQTWRDVNTALATLLDEIQPAEDAVPAVSAVEAQAVPQPAVSDLTAFTALTAEFAEQTRLLRTSIASLESAMEMQTAEMNDLRSKYENCRTVMANADEKQLAQQSLLDILHEENEKLKVNLCAVKADRQISDATLVADVRDGRERLAVSRAELATAAGQIHRLEVTLHAAEATVAELGRQRDDGWQESISKQSMQYLSNLQAQVQALVTDNRRLRKEVAGLQLDSYASLR